jgi:hypothetical protein
LAPFSPGLSPSLVYLLRKLIAIHRSVARALRSGAAMELSAGERIGLVGGAAAAPEHCSAQIERCRTC